MILCPVQRTLQEHIGRLEEKIVILKRQLRGDDVSEYQRNESQLDLANAEEALKLFRRAYQLEQKIAINVMEVV